MRVGWFFNMDIQDGRCLVFIVWATQIISCRGVVACSVFINSSVAFVSSALALCSISLGCRGNMGASQLKLSLPFFRNGFLWLTTTSSQPFLSFPFHFFCLSPTALSTWFLSLRNSLLILTITSSIQIIFLSLLPFPFLFLLSYLNSLLLHCC